MDKIFLERLFWGEFCRKNTIRYVGAAGFMTAARGLFVVFQDGPGLGQGSGGDTGAQEF